MEVLSDWEEKVSGALHLKTPSHLSPAASLCFLLCHTPLLSYDVCPHHRPDAVKAADMKWKMGTVSLNQGHRMTAVLVSIAMQC